MTFAFAALVAGGVLLLAGSRNRSIAEILRGITSPSPDDPLRGGISSLRGGASDAMGIGIAQASSLAGTVTPGVSTFDGKPVCNWIIPILRDARRRGWSGTVNDGFRSVEEQRQACINVCGNPNGCPGTCAPPGQSNHQGCVGGKGAVDVSDHVQFGQIMQQMGSPLRNALGPADPWHFSRSGK